MRMKNFCNLLPGFICAGSNNIDSYVVIHETHMFSLLVCKISRFRLKLLCISYFVNVKSSYACYPVLMYNVSNYFSFSICIKIP